MDAIIATTGVPVQPQYLMNSVKCYLCDREFIEGEEPWLIFEKRQQQDGQLECALSAILSSALDRDVDESTAHSKLLCDACNVTVLEFESIEQRFYEMRFRILTEYNKTARRNGFPPIAIEINGILQEDNVELPEITTSLQEAKLLPDEQIYVLPKLDHATQNVGLSTDEIDTLPVVQVNESLIDVEDAIILDPEDHELTEVSMAGTTDDNFNFKVLSTANIDNKNLNASDDENLVDNIVDVEDEQIDADDIIYDEIIEHDSQMSSLDEEASVDSQYMEIYSSDNNTVDVITNDNNTIISNDETSYAEEIVTMQTNKRQQSRVPRQLKDNQQPIYEQQDDVYSCLLCATKDNYNPKAFTEHMRTVHNYRFYTCDLCGSGYSRRQDLNDHMDEQHGSGEQGSFECETCQRVFTNYRLFRIHKRMHYTNTKQFECTECNKKYSSKSLLDGHMNMHTGKRPYKCPHCSKDFASKYTMQAHLKIHTERQRPFQCDICDMAFLNKQNLTQHRKLHSGVKAFVCEICSKAFGTQHNLYVHQIVHSGNKPFICRTCGKAFARRAEINDHERIHTGERPFKCDMCPMAFAQRSNLTSHKKSTHFNEKQHKCTQCDRSFKRRRLLDYHIQSTHTGERPHKCNVCGASFVYPEHHKKHMLIHSGIKPYACEVCGKQFNSRDNRNAHRFIHSNKKPYECLECGAGFMRKPLLLAHMQQTKHSNDTIIVNQPQIGIISDTFDEALVVQEDEVEEMEEVDESEQSPSESKDGYMDKFYKHMKQRDSKCLLTESSKKPYKCMECGAGFMRKPLLVAHLQQTKHQNEAIVVNQEQMIDISSDQLDETFAVKAEKLSAAEQSQSVDKDGYMVEFYEQMMHRAESILAVVDKDDEEESKSGIVRGVSGQLIKDEIGDVKYLQFEELDGDGHQTFTWVDIGDKNS